MLHDIVGSLLSSYFHMQRKLPHVFLVVVVVVVVVVCVCVCVALDEKFVSYIIILKQI